MGTELLFHKMKLNLMVLFILLFPLLACRNFLAADETPPTQVPPPPPPTRVLPGITPTPLSLRETIPTLTPVLPTLEQEVTFEQATPVPEPVLASLKKSTFLGTVSRTTIDQLQTNFYPPNHQRAAQYDVDKYEIYFRSKNESGRLVPIRAEIFIPRVDTIKEFPLFVYGAGTTGIGNQCAPLDEKLRERNWGDYQTHLLSYAAQGYITMLPHWQGYDDQTRTHLYFIAELEGYILLDATRVVYKFFENPPTLDILARPAEAVFYGGYSQGGHGAFAAYDLAAEYAPELMIKGIIGHATAPDVEALLRERPPLAPYIVYAYLNYYGGELLEPQDIFLPRWMDTFYGDASTKCVDEVYKYYPQEPQEIYQPQFLEMLYQDQLEKGFPFFKQALDDNYVGLSAETQIPVLIHHGGADTIVTPQTIKRFINRLCNLGKNVNYTLHPEVSHFQTRQYSFGDSLDWMEAVLIGNSPPSKCSEFFAHQVEE